MATFDGNIEASGHLCGIILTDGSDCPNPVPEHAPFNLCMHHFAEAARWFRSIDTTTRTASECDLCDKTTVFDLPLGGTECAFCGQRSEDARGELLLTDHEREKLSF